MGYNRAMEQYQVLIIGGGASGLMLANALPKDISVLLLESGSRVGKKLSATGNGQGNITNLHAIKGGYFSASKKGEILAEKIIQSYPPDALIKDFERLGVLTVSDDKGRVYPASRQASSITDALRFALAEKKIKVKTDSKALSIAKNQNGFLVEYETKGEKCQAQANQIVLCAGGNVAKNFGTDGNGYRLAQSFGHTLTKIYPSLVQLKTDTTHTKTLKGIRVSDAILTATWQTQGEEKTIAVKGDVIFTDYGISGDAVFKLSAYVTDKIDKNVTLHIDFMPDFSKEYLKKALYTKQAVFKGLDKTELLFGFVNHQIGRAIIKRSAGDLDKAVALVKDFTLSLVGHLGADYAQVTKGGVAMTEVEDTLESKLVQGLYFAGEILDVDGACGGYNLQWAYASAKTVAKAITQKYMQYGVQV